MDRDAWDLSPDSVQRALDQLGPRSGGRVIREAFYGTSRFEDFLRRTGVTAPVLSTRLRELEAAGLLAKVPYREPGLRTRHEYRLTERGLDLAVAVVALLDWGDRWAAGEAGPTVVLTHAGCGAGVHAALRCGHGHDVAARELELAPGPGATPA